MLNSENAAKITKDSLVPESVIIVPYMEHIDKRIRTEALAGRRSISNPFSRSSASGIGYPSIEIVQAVRKAVEQLGYSWQDHPDPDPGHPCSSSYTTISW